MPLFEFADNVRPRKAGVLQQHGEMVGKVGGFVDGFFLIAGGGGKRGFHAFFADFLRDAFAACGVEAGGVGAFGVGAFARGDKPLEPGEKDPVRWKQLCAPVWQVAPTGVARMSRVSLSQSALMPLRWR